MVQRRTSGLWVLVALAVAQPVATVVAKDDSPAKVDPAVIRSRLPELEKRLADWERVMHAREIAGMGITVVLGDDVIFSRTLGQRDPIAGLPVTKDTMFYIASCTKTFTAMAIMTLVDEGKVNLDAPAKKYLPRFELADKEATSTLTIRDLLSHAKGLDSDPASALEAYTGEITDDRFYYWLKKAKPKGEFAYSNLHFTLLGRVIQAVTGESWKDYLQRRILEPAGMYETTAYASKLYGSNDHAVPCYFDGSHIVPSPTLKTDRTMHAAGGLGTSLNDLSRWLRLNLDDGVIDGRRIVSADSVKAMQQMQCASEQPPRMPGSTRDGYGFGWFVGTYHGYPMVEHGGGYAGTAASISLMPQQDLGVAVVANGSSSLVAVVAFEVYGALLGLERSNQLDRLEAACKPHFERVRAWRTNIERHPVDKDALSLPLANYVGTYVNPHWGTMVIGQKDGALTLQFGDLPLELATTGKDKFDMYSGLGNGDAGWFEGTKGNGPLTFVFKSDAGNVRFVRTNNGPS